MAYPGKQALLPPKCPFTSSIGSKAVQKPGEANISHHRTSSETLLLEEQPSWLDDLLNEPESPVRKGGHRRSSSDSFAYVHVHDAFDVDYTLWDSGRFDNNTFSALARGPNLSAHHVSFHPSFHVPKQKYRAPNRTSGYLEATGNLSLGSSSDSNKDVSMQFMNTSEKRDNSLAKSAASEADTKRARQQFAQRSRVRKIQYIAELERNVQMLEVEGSEVSAELDFLNQQNLILSLENKALKKRLESLAQEQLIKYLEHDVLEKEIGRLRALYQQQQQHEQHEQQQQQQTEKQGSSSYQQSKSRDLDSQFMNLTLRP